ncbi:hypothetical protein KUL72_12555 [Bradyrhizobium arachidis]|uniref:hypothetical protein n=1 Tax=Bradyrhizobium TaxID=374 RepID=UPI00188C07C2|nr:MULTISPECIES: hypothetical protein [Bradyrhizobium]MDN4986659.1 hypothetical protein [Bradyrhizobium sp. WYCCWR 13022]UVO39113.1 hypothetical protein KUL72_12555 [Bradyrhizobium arachidis]
MTDKTEVEDYRPGRAQPRPSCPTCKTPSRYITSMLDVRRDRSILIYRCDTCREEIWQ